MQELNREAVQDSVAELEQLSWAYKEYGLMLSDVKGGYDQGVLVGMLNDKLDQIVHKQYALLGYSDGAE